MITSLRTKFALAVVAAALLQGQTAGLREFAIVDPVLRMTAWTVPVPASWRAEGTMLPGSSCNSGTSPVFRVSSPDGLSGGFILPRTDWAWGAGVRSSADCMPWQEAVSARDFLTYQARIDKLGFVRDEPVPELADLRGQMARYDGTADMARYRVRYSLNGRPVEERITATITCQELTAMGVGTRHSCSAFVDRWFAPLGKLDAMLPTFGNMHPTINPQWMSEWTSHSARGMNDLYAPQTAALLDQGRLAQATRMQRHQEFMTSMQVGRDRRDIAFQERLYRKTENKENYVDHILDCQRAYSGVNRVSVGNCPNRETR
jgi:hypothetical protein